MGYVFDIQPYEAYSNFSIKCYAFCKQYYEICWAAQNKFELTLSNIIMHVEYVTSINNKNENWNTPFTLSADDSCLHSTLGPDHGRHLMMCERRLVSKQYFFCVLRCAWQFMGTAKRVGAIYSCQYGWRVKYHSTWSMRCVPQVGCVP